MVYLDCSGVRFGSQLDEKHLFHWAREIRSVINWEQDTLLIRSKRISEESLRDLLALFWRYNIPLAQLAQFKNAQNEEWFTSPKMYWHKRVFGPKSNHSLQPTASGRG
ncbi:hypothetical protein [Roseateles sp. P5_E8]